MGTTAGYKDIIDCAMGAGRQFTPLEYQNGRNLNIKAKEGIDTKDLKGELTSLLRRSRRLRPIEKNNFALNEMSTLATVIEGVMGALNIAGYFIGFFSILIGMFSVHLP